MKTLLLSIYSIFILNISCSSLDKDILKSKKTKENIEVIIRNDWNTFKLDSLTNALLSKNIEFSYKILGFDNKNLKGLEIKVNTKDGYKGSASVEDFTNNIKFGFMRNYSKTSEIQFKVGIMN